MRSLPALLLLLGLTGLALAQNSPRTPGIAMQEPQSGRMAPQDAEDAEDEDEDPEELRRALRQAQRELALTRAQAELARLESAAEEQTAAREAEAALAALNEFENFALAARMAESELELKHEEDGMEDARDEMQQLAALYGEGDLADRTAEIVLRRAARGLERAEESLRQARAAHHQLANIQLPREQLELRAAVRAAEMELRLIEARRGVAALEQQNEIAQLEERIAELERDLAEAQAEQAR
jgi:hypothetical protein